MRRAVRHTHHAAPRSDVTAVARSHGDPLEAARRATQMQRVDQKMQHAMRNAATHDGHAGGKPAKDEKAGGERNHGSACLWPCHGRDKSGDARDPSHPANGSPAVTRAAAHEWWRGQLRLTSALRGSVHLVHGVRCPW